MSLIDNFKKVLDKLDNIREDLALAMTDSQILSCNAGIILVNYRNIDIKGDFKSIKVNGKEIYCIN